MIKYQITQNHILNRKVYEIFEKDAFRRSQYSSVKSLELTNIFKSNLTEPLVGVDGEDNNYRIIYADKKQNAVIKYMIKRAFVEYRYTRRFETLKIGEIWIMNFPENRSIVLRGNGMLAIMLSGNIYPYFYDTTLCNRE